MERFKRTFLVLFAALTVLLTPSANAITQKIELIEAQIIDKSEAVTAEELVFEDNTISSNITFGKENDSIKILLKLKNTSGEEYKITGITDNISKNFETSYSYNNENIAKDDITEVTATIRYAHKALNVEKLSFTDITITFELTKDDGTTESFTLNPKTNDNIFYYSIASITAIVALIVIAIASKKKRTKYIACSAILLSLAAFPIATSALEESKSAIMLTNIDILGEFEIYAIPFDPDNREASTTKDVQYGDTIGELPGAPSKNGYDFDNWVDEKGEPISPDTQITAPIKIKASYTPIDYDIHYDLGGGEIEDNPTTYNIETNSFILPEPSKEHYDFAGWTGSNCETPEKEVRVSKGSTGELNYTANYTPKNYTIRFNANGGQIANADATRSVTYNTQIGELPTASLEGFGLAGWFTEAESGTKISKNTLVEDTTEYYAHWLDDSSLATNIISNKANTETDYQIDFIKQAVISDNAKTRNGNGINTYKEGDQDIYYYRGEIYDNNVIWADKCWKILRTTKTGGTKLVYNGEPSEVDINGETTLQCLATGDDTLIENLLYIPEAKEENESQEAYEQRIHKNKVYAPYNDGTGCDIEGACSPAYFGYMYGTVSNVYKFRPSTTATYYFSDGATVSGNESTLVTGDGHSYKGSWQDADLRNQVKEDHHYFCPNNNVYKCSNSLLKWKFYASGQYVVYALSLNGYNNPDDLLNDMQQNTTDSNAKKIIDAWYEANLLDNEDDLEDAVFCGEKAWGKGPFYDHKNTGTYSYSAVMRRVGGYDNQMAEPSLECSKENSFTTDEANGNGKLTHKIGLISADEAALAGNGRMDAAPEGYLTSGVKHWTMSPYAMVGSTPYVIAIGNNGGQLGEYIRQGGNSSFNIGIRPSVSLRAGIRFTSGSGLKTDPFIAE